MAMASGVCLSSDVVINEFVSSNGSLLADEDGDFEDWIELYNCGLEPANLQGWWLSDDEEDPFGWEFPEAELPPGGYLLIWASGKDRRANAGALHTDFRISADGEPLFLVRPDGSLADFVKPIAVGRDHSWGRQPDGSGNWFFFTEPTPAAPNTTAAFHPSPPPPAFSREGGFFTEPFQLVLDGADSETTILYTLDGSIPDPSNLDGRTYSYKQQYPESPGDPEGEFFTASYRSHVYEGPLPIEEQNGDPPIAQISTTYHRDLFYFPSDPVFHGTVVRAMAMKAGSLPSPVVTHSYFVTPEGTQRYRLPVISIAIQENHLFDYDVGVYTAGTDFDEWRRQRPTRIVDGWFAANYRRSGSEAERPAHLELFDGTSGRLFAHETGFRIHGGATRSHPQKSIRLYARSAESGTAAFDYPFFPGLRGLATGKPIDSFPRILLRNSGNDGMASHRVHAGISATRMRDAFLHRLTAPSGLDHQADQPAVLFLNGVFWGLINIRERIDRCYLAAHHGIDPEDVALINGVSEVAEGTPDDLADLRLLDAIVAGHDMKDPWVYTYVSGKMDIENFLQYCAIHVYIKNTDWPGNNRRAWRKRTSNVTPGTPPTHDGRWRWILYDLDFGFGSAWDQEPGGQAGASHNTLAFATEPGGVDWPNPDWSTAMPRQLLTNPTAARYFVNVMADYMNTIFVPEWAVALVDEMHGGIAPHLDEHSARWVGTGSTDPNFLRVFAHARPQWMRQHVMEYFDLPGTAEVTLHTPHPERGSLRINTVTISPDTPGLADPQMPYPWTGTYFQGVPIEIEAIPAPGYRFTQWENMPEEGKRITVDLTSNAVFTALFEERLEPLPPPVVKDIPGLLEASRETLLTLDLGSMFEHSSGSMMSFSAASSDTSRAVVTVEGSHATIYMYRAGGAYIHFTADDGVNEPVSATSRLLIYPDPRNLANSTFLFTEWSPDARDGDYPLHMLFLQSDVPDPGLETPLLHPYFIPHDDYNSDDFATIGFPYNNTRRTRINGLGEAGLSFINTGRDRDLGGALLAVNTVGIPNVHVSWLAGTITSNSRTYAIRLQYRIGNSGPFQDLLIDGNPLEYLAGHDGETREFGPIVLPPDLLGRSNLQLLWRYYLVEGTQGPRAELRLDNIEIRVPPDPSLPNLWVLY